MTCFYTDQSRKLKGSLFCLLVLFQFQTCQELSGEPQTHTHTQDVVATHNNNNNNNRKAVVGRISFFVLAIKCRIGRQ